MKSPLPKQNLNLTDLGPTKARPLVHRLARFLGYQEEELVLLPKDVNLGLSCGNPLAGSPIKQGDCVLDLGCGHGFDSFMAAPKVGEWGMVIGVDRNQKSIEKARLAMGEFSGRTGLSNLDFRHGEIEDLPVPDDSCDLIISNCVLHLTKNKSLVWREISRVLKPGGTISIADLALLKPLSREMKSSMAAFLGCFTGIIHLEEIKEQMKSAELVEVKFITSPDQFDKLTDFEAQPFFKVLNSVSAGKRVSEFLGCAKFFAKKPVSRPRPGNRRDEEFP